MNCSRTILFFAMLLTVIIPCLTGCAEETAPTKPAAKPAAKTKTLAKTPKKHKHTNRLIHEKSPYLLQHAHNPVDWHPWGKEAFALAKKEDKPVFLSVGYATCHWCHVMERESFENEKIAKVMNDNFICIKVDREERPDVDKIYMAVVQRLTGSGGWPMSVFLTPEGKPFYGGTYYPPTSRGGRPGFPQILLALSNTWKTNKKAIDNASNEITKKLQELVKKNGSGVLSEKMLANSFAAYDRIFDAQHGGFGRAPKFPTPHNLLFLLRYSQRTGNKKSLEMVTTTLDNMMQGGIQDHLGGGFHRYSTDRVWLAPHFEKMLYDQAMISRAYVEAWQVTQNPAYKKTAEDIFKYVLRDMTDKEGGFYSAEDADSEGMEGKFYLWKPAEVIQLLGKEKGTRFCKFYNIIENGNFSEHGVPTGLSIIHITQNAAVFAKEQGMTTATFLAELEEGKTILFNKREKRIRPIKDDKVLTAWNGLMIASLAHAARVFENDEYAKAAEKSANFLLAKLQKEGRVLRRWRNGESALLGYLNDYSFLSWGLYELYIATGDSKWLKESHRLSKESIRLFWDEKNGGLFFSGNDGEKLITQTKESYDGAIPSGNSVAALNFLRLGHLMGNPKLEERGVAVMKAFSSQLERGLGSSFMLCALNFHEGSNQEIVIAGNPEAPNFKTMRSIVCTPYLPNAVFVFHADNDTAIEKLVPFVKVQRAKKDKPTAYVCKDYACQLPTNDLERLKKSIEKLK